MGTRLYVANLPDAPSALALRAHFSACGVVSDIEIVPDRNAGRGRGSALVRMNSAADAERAISKLNGALFAGQLLQVEPAPDHPGDRRGAAHRKAEQAAEQGSRAHITLQFREAANMTYELECAGVALVVRVFFPTTTGLCRVAAQASGAPDTTPGTTAVAPSRLEAFRSVVSACREGGALAHIDWEAVEEAMKKVRAL